MEHNLANKQEYDSPRIVVVKFRVEDGFDSPVPDPNNQLSTERFTENTNEGESYYF